MKKTKLLIVDDEWLIADSLSTMEEWDERNIEVVAIAHNGHDAIRYLKTEPIELVLSDIRMPDMNGLQLLQYIYEEMPGTQVVLISGYEDFIYAKEALRYGAKGYILKPIDTDELFDTIDRLLELRHLKTGSTDRSDVESSEVSLTYHEEIVRKAMKYIDDNLHHPLSLSDVAQTVHLTPHYFGQLFKNESGQLFNSYLTRVRMEKACELLKRPGLKIYEICEQVGFIDPKYFAKVFQKQFGVSPNEFRHQN
ncbi:response regulator [Paenibacillus sp. PL91]|uniref:response regulator transcription factor n=1 Tax=Paenibacillus sp. PL91 TaxID=2729538 RepID=UPI00145CD3CE|nr:response regulator [Paenibacillus sp. PL91]MBC9204911.1 response regulator [Paenibacillus sp. PL91]